MSRLRHRLRRASKSLKVMGERILISETINYVGKLVAVEGWVYLRRDHGKLIFLSLRDRSGMLQIVVNANVSQSAFEAVKDVRPEFVLRIEGTVKKRPENAVDTTSPAGSVELEAKGVEILAKAETLPFDMGGKDLNLELPTLLDHRSLTLRHPKVAAIFRVQKTIVKAYRSVLENEDFTEIFVPTIVPATAEGGAEVFSVDYFNNKAYLAQSPQVYKQIMVSVFERVFTIAHAYRAEPSVTTRHLTEYTSLDAEMGFINSWEDLMEKVEKVIKSILEAVKKENKQELEMFNVAIPEIKIKIPRLKLAEAQEILFKKTGVDHRREPDLAPNEEKEICAWAKEETGAPFVFVTHYPVKKRPFYTMPDPGNVDLTLSFDMLGFTEEWVTGGQRINDYKMILEHIEKWGNKKENFEIYLQGFRYGMPPEGGFAMGLERLTKDILGLTNIREASLFPRDMERVDERFSR